MYAAVFPVPDLEAPSTSIPFCAIGIIFLCILVGSVYFTSFIACKILGFKFSFSKASILSP